MMKNNNKHYQKPIEPSKPLPFGYRCYIDKKGINIIDQWKQEISKRGLANLDSVLKILKDQPRASWNRPHACSIGDNIYVIHFKDETGKQYRPTGNFLDEYNSFVITTKVLEKGNQYDPSNYIDTAKHRKNEVISNPECHSHACFASITTPYCNPEHVNIISQLYYAKLPTK